MKQSLQLRTSQHLALTPQLQQSIRLLQLSTLELHQEIEQILSDNPLLERLDDPLDRSVRLLADGAINNAPPNGEAPAPAAPAQEGEAAPAASNEAAEGFEGGDAERDASDADWGSGGGSSGGEDEDGRPQGAHLIQQYVDGKIRIVLPEDAKEADLILEKPRW